MYDEKEQATIKNKIKQSNIQTSRKDQTGDGLSTNFLFLFWFLRSVFYRQFTRLVWDFVGSSKPYPYPCCSYKAIRTAFQVKLGNIMALKMMNH